MATVLFFLSSGLFLGWSLGANHAGNVFGTAVASRMIKFGTAALICSIFVILGSVISGAGVTATLGQLGSVSTMAGGFTVAFSTALTVGFMTKLGLPVSTSQTIVGGIVGWDLFSGHPIDFTVLSHIVGTWVLCPFIAMGISVALYFLVKHIMDNGKFHLMRIDHFTRMGLVLVGAFGSYSLGANNIANVMGVFVPSNPFPSVSLWGYATLSGTQLLFLLGGVSIAIGVYTYSKKVIMTVGDNIVKLSPMAALIVVLASSVVMFMFSSRGLQHALLAMHLPTLPLAPISSSQAVVGAVIGIGLVRNARQVKFGVLGKISIGWVAAPVAAAIITFVSLYFMQNVFTHRVF